MNFEILNYSKRNKIKLIIKFSIRSYIIFQCKTKQKNFCLETQFTKKFLCLMDFLSLVHKFSRKYKKLKILDRNNTSVIFLYAEGLWKLFICEKIKNFLKNYKIKTFTSTTRTFELLLVLHNLIFLVQSSIEDAHERY